MASRSCGGINFGEVHLSQFNVAATSGLCLRNPPTPREFHHHVVTHDVQHRAAQEHRHPQCPRLSIRRVGGGLALIQAQQVEGEQDCQERRLRRKERL